MSGWIKIGVEFIKAVAGQGKGSSHPNAPVETMDTMAEEAPGADSIAVRPEGQISIRLALRPTSKKLRVAAKLCDSFSMIFGCPPRTSRGHLRSASIGPKATSTNDWLRVERHGSLTPRVGNTSASRRRLD